MPLLAKFVGRPISVAAGAAALLVLAQLNLVSAASAAPLSAPRAGVAEAASYAAAVADDSPAHFWRLDESAAGPAADSAGDDDLTVDASATRGTSGPAGTAITFTGGAAVPAAASELVEGPQSFAVEAWFATTSTTGGKIVGLGNSRTGTSSYYDRHLYLTDAGQLTFGVFPGAARTLTTTEAYNDGEWHQVVGSMSPAGMDLFVDGRQVGHDTSAAGAEPYSGYWRIGGDNLGNWPGRPTTSSLTGSLADVAVYPAPLGLEQVQAHYAASGRSVGTAAVPADAYGAAVVNDTPSLYWRLDETSGTRAKDEVSGDPASGTYSAGVVLGRPGSPAHRTGTAIGLPGSTAETLVSAVQVVNPTVYSLETWFRTTTSRGGRLIGFGNAASGTSTNYDRHIYMLDSGRLRYGTYTSQQRMTVDSPASYNDGAWHHVVATQGPNGQQLFVDGVRVGTGTAVRPQNYTGYWRLGADRIWDDASSTAFAGELDEAAVYPAAVLPAAAVAQHFALGTVPPNASPSAAFTSAGADLRVTFDASGSSDPDGSIASYAWDFGDGTSGTGVRPAHTYRASGTYTAVLTVTDNQGATALVSHPVTVTANVAPVAAFSSECADLDCTFDGSASADPDGSIASYAWTFGDGGTATGAEPAHSYTTAGSHDVTLTVTDDDGTTGSITQAVTVTARNNPPTAAFTSACTDLACTFDAAGSTDPDGTIAAYAWTFGDGRTGSARQGTHTYAEPGVYTVTLTVTDNRGATGSASAVVTAVAPNRPPVAALTADCTDLVCAFSAAGASDPDGSITGYAWTFGDGATSTAVAPTHTYAPGTFTVTLTVTDDDGARDSATRQITAVAPNRPPVAAFTSTVADRSVTVDAAASSDNDGTITAYAWTFGDGSTATGVSPAAHRYAVAGTYTVTLTVTDDDGASDTLSAAVTATDRVVAVDTFGRELATGLGSAEIGGPWTATGPGLTTSVTGGSARIEVLPARTNVFRLSSATTLDTDLAHTFWLEQMPSGAGATLTTIVRGSSTADYRLNLRIAPVGGMTAQLARIGGGDGPISLPVVVPGGNYTVNKHLRIRVQAFGTSPTSVRAKVWPAAEPEPADWLVSATDSTAVLQQAGSLGLVTFFLGNFSSSVIRIDDVESVERSGLR